MMRLRAAWRRWSVSPPLIRFTRARITLQWWLAGKPVPAPNVVKQRTVIRYGARYRLRTFIETGTYTGEMVHAMIGHADRIVSIEVAPRLHARAVQRFAGRPNVQLLLGDSAVLLPRLLATLDGPALFWLDGHFMGGESGRGQEDTPVVAEMAALLSHHIRGHVILIDDARLFDGTCGYPRLTEFTQWVAERRPGTDVSVDGDIIRCIFDRAAARWRDWTSNTRESRGTHEPKDAQSSCASSRLVHDEHDGTKTTMSLHFFPS